MSALVMALVSGSPVALPAADEVEFPHVPLGVKSIAGGVVVKDGVAVEGADVLVLSMPADLESVPIGGLVYPRTVGAASTDALGRFTVNVDPAAIPPGHADEDGAVRIELVIADDEHEVRWNDTAVPARHPVRVGGAPRCGGEGRTACRLGEPAHLIPVGVGGTDRLKVVVEVPPGAYVTPLWSSAHYRSLGGSLPLQVVADLGAMPSVRDVNDALSGEWPGTLDGEFPGSADPGSSRDPVPLVAVTAPPLLDVVTVSAAPVPAMPRDPTFAEIAARLRSGRITAAQMVAGTLGATGG
ncbi:hypothetical protein [Sphaerisporangium krabiense]|uniref:Uncharacterized protein n=1 Tax=Sphaerisporangium krabiense TaxID=763782 RepID=A0A7W8ZC86_9ACTN|nr:hypothetical protein [Sphaerisporangium krabiense]MBB5631230.1 hypothetical protein [Sphaerisporangium krabiense]